jgi:hypothetical protein
VTPAGGICGENSIDIERRKNRLLKFCFVPATSAAHNRLLFFSFLLQPFTVLMKQTRQAVCTIKQSIFLDVYGKLTLTSIEKTTKHKFEIIGVLVTFF